MGAKAAIGSMKDVDFLTATFKGADIVYVMEANGPNWLFDPGDVLVSITSIGYNYKQAIQQAGVKKVVHLSSIGAHTNKGNGILAVHYEVENLLSQLPADVSIKIMRPVVSITICLRLFQPSKRRAPSFPTTVVMIKSPGLNLWISRMLLLKKWKNHLRAGKFVI